MCQPSKLILSLRYDQLQLHLSQGMRARHKTETAVHKNKTNHIRSHIHKLPNHILKSHSISRLSLHRFNHVRAKNKLLVPLRGLRDETNASNAIMFTLMVLHTRAYKPILVVPQIFPLLQKRRKWKL